MPIFPNIELHCRVKKEKPKSKRKVRNKEVAIVRSAGEPLHAFIKFSTGRQFVNGAAGQKEPFPEPVIK